MYLRLYCFIIVLITSLTSHASLVIFSENQQIKANDINNNFSHIKSILEEKNINISFSNFLQGDVILRDNLENEFEKLRAINIMVNPLHLLQIKAQELNTSFTQMELGASLSDDIPIAYNSTISMTEDSQFIGNFNIYNEIGTASIQIIQQPTSGVINIGIGNSFTYIPNLNYNGIDIITYKVFDGNYYSNTATISITITPINDQPIVNELSVTVNNDSTFSGQLTSTDVDSSSFTYNIIQNPTKGTLVLNSTGSFTYTPFINSIGEDTFLVVSNDGISNSINKNILLNINCASSFHEESGACLSNTRSCPITNGSGSQSWNGTGYSQCIAVACNSGFYIISDGSCSAVSEDTADGLWPQGTTSALVVNTGSTVTIPAGTTQDYQSITVHSGGTLIIDGTSSQNPTILGSVGDITINGTIIGQEYYLGGGANSKTSPRGDVISYTINQAVGGVGGRGGQEYGAGSYGGSGGAAGSLGCGGGGGGGRYSSSSSGGKGGTNCGAGYSAFNSTTPTTILSNGNSNKASAKNGGNAPALNIVADGNLRFDQGAGIGGGAAFSHSTTTYRWYTGGGGGGGYPGKHGLGLMLYTRKNIIGTGTINLSGTNGFNGGNGWTGNQANGTGGGGGGGAGGSGGILIIKKRTSTPTNLILQLDRGTGGTGGAAGTPTVGDRGGAVGQTGGRGDNGTAGGSGTVGSSSIIPH